MSSVFSTFFVVFSQQKNPSKINNLRKSLIYNDFYFMRIKQICAHKK